jgi:hypothetical protein
MPIASARTGYVYPIDIARDAALAVHESDPAPKPRLLDRVRAAIRARHYSRRGVRRVDPPPGTKCARCSSA